MERGELTVEGLKKGEEGRGNKRRVSSGDSNTQGSWFGIRFDKGPREVTEKKEKEEEGKNRSREGSFCRKFRVDGKKKQGCHSPADIFIDHIVELHL